MENGEDCRKVASGFPPSLSQSKNSSRRVSSTDRSESEDYENFLLGKSGTITGAYVLHRRDTSTRRRLSSVSFATPALAVLINFVNLLNSY